MATATLAATSAAAAPPRHEAATRAPPAAGAAADVTLSVDAAHPGHRIPTRFLGLSFEARELPAIARIASGGGNPAALLRSLGPGTLRFGGNSVDATTAWVDGASPPPRWARVEITPTDLDGIGRLARASGWNVLLAVTLGHPDAAAAAREVAAAKASLGPLLAGVEIGNEPDEYVKKGLRRRPWGYSRYRAQVARYRTAIAAAAPGVPLAGPDLASAKPSRWLAAYARQERPRLLTAHFYPLIRCGHMKPTIAQLVSPDLHASEQRILERLVGLAGRARIPMRLGETNNVACSGEPGVSDTYASALWALDYVVRVAEAGIGGLNFHGFVGECRTYTPLCAPRAAARLSARPEWYALLAARSLAGARLLSSALTPAPPGLTTVAARLPHARIEVVAINFETRPVRLALRLPHGTGRLNVLRLSGPGLRARSGVRLGGRAVSPGGGWSGTPSPAGSGPVTIAPFSATVVTTG